MNKSLLKNFLIIIAIAIPIVVLIIVIDNKSLTPSETLNNLETNVLHRNFINFSANKSVTPTPKEEKTVQIIINSKDVKEIKQTGWIPYWDLTEAVNSINGYSNYDSLSPVIYYLNEDGSLKKTIPGDLSRFKAACKLKGIKVIPTLSVFDYSYVKNALRRDSSKTPLYKELAQEVENQKFDGIDIDIESTELEDKELFHEFISNLSTELHKKNKILSVTVIAKWGENITYGSLPQTREVQDWEKLAAKSDQIRIMTYDYTSQRSTKPGPIAPINWMENVLKYAVTKIPAEKIWVGVHLYSYEWATNPITSTPSPSENLTDTTTPTDVPVTYQPAKSYLNRSLQEILAKSNPEITYNQTYQEGIAKYACNKVSQCVTYYPTKESIQARRELAAKYGISGVAYWRVGREGDLLK